MVAIEKWALKLCPEGAEGVKSLFSELALWSSARHWRGAGFTRLVMELADLPGDPARAVAGQHKAVKARLALAFGSAQAGAEVVLLIEGALTLLLSLSDRRYADIDASAASALVCRHRA
jgi:hypothetical protein